MREPSGTKSHTSSWFVICQWGFKYWYFLYMHLCIISDFLDKSFQDYYVLSCEVATKTGTPLFSSGIFWTATVLPQPPALSLARPCLCQILLEPSSAHLLKENKTKHQQFFSSSDNRWRAQVKNPVPLSFTDTAAMGSTFRKKAGACSGKNLGPVLAHTADQIAHPLPIAVRDSLLVAQ